MTCQEKINGNRLVRPPKSQGQARSEQICLDPQLLQVNSNGSEIDQLLEELKINQKVDHFGNKNNANKIHTEAELSIH
jgi:hypothetical protein